MKRHIFFLIFSVLLTQIEAKNPESSVVVTPILEDMDAVNNGIIYCLPQTVLRVKVVAEMTIEKVGPFYRYSNKYLNLNDVITEDRNSWKILNASVEAYGKANDAQRYKITIDNAKMPGIRLTKDGVISGVNSEVIVEEDYSDEAIIIPEMNFDCIKLDRSVLTKTATAAMAEESANMIYRLREKRQHLLGGDDVVILHDEGSYDRVLAEIDSLEADYVSLFAGKRERIMVEKTFTVIPDPRGMASTVVARFSQTEGFLDVMNLNGKPIYVDITFEKCARASELGADSKERKKEPLTGLRYIIPCSMRVKVVDRNILLTEEEIMCSQNGQVGTLPASILLDEDVVIEMDSANGSIKGISYKK